MMVVLWLIFFALLGIMVAALWIAQNYADKIDYDIRKDSRVFEYHYLYLITPNTRSIDEHLSRAGKCGYEVVTFFSEQLVSSDFRVLVLLKKEVSPE